MALNNFMHPRNIYRKPPDFRELSKKYPEFSSICKMDVSGKITINFKDPHSLRILTKYLLKSDFNIDMDIPEDRLVPTLPLRLNYILWLEDLLNSTGKNSNVCGIDIGTGACAIYPVLAVKSNQWSMVGTETDEDSLRKALHNIERNNLSEFIKLSKNPTSSIVEYLLQEDESKQFEFCMCNPPFYSSIQELCESRNPSRCPPKNGFTGSPQELITEGGELRFCRKLISESKLYKDRILIFTTMVGHKYNLKELLQDLTADGIKHTHTEFCQGRVTRWGLAWTFQDFNLKKLVPPREKIRKTNAPIKHQLTKLPNHPFDVNTCSEKIKSMLSDINIETKLVNKRGMCISMHISALNNTWSHQRRKRRLMKQNGDGPEAKKNKMESLNHNNQHGSLYVPEDNERNIDSRNNNENMKQTNDIECKEPIVEALVKVVKVAENILFQIEYLSGNAGKEGVHQIVQYIKNNWK